MATKDIPALLAYGKKQPHGTRSRYVSGCRCRRCRNTNTELYHRERAPILEQAKKLDVPKGWRTVIEKGDLVVTVTMKPHCRMPKGDGFCAKRISYNNTVPICSHCQLSLKKFKGRVLAEPARKHILLCAKAGLGQKSLAKLSGVGKTCISQIRWGGKKYVFAETLEKILAVSPRKTMPGHRIPSKHSWELIREMQEKAWLRPSEINARLGFKCMGIQVGKHGLILIRNAKKVAKLHREVMKELANDYIVPEPTLEKEVTKALEQTGLSRRELAKRLGWVNLTPRAAGGKVHWKHLEELKQFLGKQESKVVGPKIRAEKVHEVLGKIRRLELFEEHEMRRALGWETLNLPVGDTLVDAQLYDEAVQLLTKEQKRLENEQDFHICTNCGFSHEKKARQARIRRMIPCDIGDIMEAFPCIYPMGTKKRKLASGEIILPRIPRMLNRDLEDIGAEWVPKTTMYRFRDSNSTEAVGIRSKQEGPPDLHMESGTTTSIPSEEETEDAPADLGEGQELHRHRCDGAEHARRGLEAHDHGGDRDDPAGARDEDRAGGGPREDAVEEGVVRAGPPHPEGAVA